MFCEAALGVFELLRPDFESGCPLGVLVRVLAAIGRAAVY
jgi:hypothetical protein